METLQQWLISLLTQYAGPCLAIVLFVDLFKQFIRKDLRKVVCRAAVFLCACGVAVAMRYLRDFGAWEAVVQGSLLTVMAIVCYDCGAYSKIKCLLQNKFKTLPGGSK